MHKSASHLQTAPLNILVSRHWHTEDQHQLSWVSGPQLLQLLLRSFRRKGTQSEKEPRLLISKLLAFKFLWVPSSHRFTGSPFLSFCWDLLCQPLLCMYHEGQRCSSFRCKSTAGLFLSLSPTSLCFNYHSHFLNYTCLDWHRQGALSAMMAMFYSALLTTAAAGHMWLLSIWNMATAIEECSI